VQAYLRRMAQYNRWANDRLFEAALKLPATAINENRAAPYGSILGTLNHIYIADVLWLIRFGSNPACHALAPIGDIPKPTSLAEVLYDALGELREGRADLDALIIDFSHTWTDEMLEVPIRYHALSREKQEHPLCELLQNLFNHQTHHRGEVVTLLFQAGIDPGPLDVVAMVGEE